MFIWFLPLALFILTGLTSWQAGLWPLWLVSAIIFSAILLWFSFYKSPWQKRLRLSSSGLIALHLAGIFGLYVTAEADWWRSLIFMSSFLILLFWAAEIRAKKETGVALAWLQVLTFIYGLFGLVTGLGAFSSLADYAPWWLIIGSAILTGWGLYSLFLIFNVHTPRWWLWAGVALFLILEIGGIIWWLPLGAYTQGVLAALFSFALLLNFDIPKAYSGFTRSLVWIFILIITGSIFYWSISNIF